jgi:hypothetical protein
MMEDFVPGTMVVARFDTSQLSFLTQARICRSGGEDGTIALEFVEVSQHGRDQLQTLMSDLEDRQRARRWE